MGADSQLALSREGVEMILRDHARKNPHLEIGSDASWISAYITLRQTKKRVRSEDIAEAHKSRRTDLSNSGYREVVFYGAPKSNFAGNVLPPHLHKYLADDGRVREMELRENCALDREAFFLFDRSVLKVFDDLGLNVEKFGFKLKQNTTYQQPSDTSAQPGNIDAASGSAHPASIGMATVGSLGGTAGASSFTTTEGGQAVGPHAKEVSDLSQIYSDPTSKRTLTPAQKQTMAQAAAFKTLKAKTLENAEAGRWEGAATGLSKESVFHYVSESLQAIKETAAQRKVGNMPEGVVELGKDGPKPPRDFMAAKFATFLADLIYKSPCYPGVRSFEDVPRQLYVMGGVDDSPGADEDVLRLVEMLARAKVDSDEVLDTGSVSVFARTPFFESAVYRSYVEARASFLLGAAQASGDPAQRCDMLRK